MFFDNIHKFKNNIALFLNDNNKVYFRDILSISNKFQKIIKKRSLTILIVDNCLESLCGYIALLRSNNVIMLLDSNIKDKDLKSSMPVTILEITPAMKKAVQEGSQSLFEILGFATTGAVASKAVSENIQNNNISN